MKLFLILPVAIFPEISLAVEKKFGENGILPETPISALLEMHKSKLFITYLDDIQSIIFAHEEIHKKYSKDVIAEEIAYWHMGSVYKAPQAQELREVHFGLRDELKKAWECAYKTFAKNDQARKDRTLPPISSVLRKASAHPLATYRDVFDSSFFWCPIIAMSKTPNDFDNRFSDNIEAYDKAVDEARERHLEELKNESPDTNSDAKSE